MNQSKKIFVLTVIQIYCLSSCDVKSMIKNYTKIPIYIYIYMLIHQYCFKRNNFFFTFTNKNSQNNNNYNKK